MVPRGVSKQEKTMTLTPEQLTIRSEKALATTRRKAIHLECHGYTIEAIEAKPGVYLVYPPQAESLDDAYEVDLFNETCTCMQFFYHEECKHLLATRALILKALKLTAPFFPQGLPTVDRL
jgi:hypothetical protein